MKIFRRFIGHSVMMGWLGGCTYGLANHNEGFVAAGAFLFFATLFFREWLQ